ncbi:MAG: phytanoyl-CoA dioxygenase family protein [Acidobacteriota bacterium]
MRLTEHQKHFFDTFGFLRFNGLMADCIDEITNAFEQVWVDTSGHHGSPHDGTKRSLIVPFIDRHERLCRLLDDERIHGILSGLLGPDFNYCSSDGNYYVGDTPYHSRPYFGGLKALKVAFYLDPLTADTGCLRVIPGSHRYGDSYADSLHETAPEPEEAWGIESSQVPAIALETRPGDILVFNHGVKHGAFGGGSYRRLFVINAAEHCPDDKLDGLRTMISSFARFWIDEYYGKTMIETADEKRMRNLQQIIDNQGHLPALAAKARSEMSEPSRK